MKDEEISVAAEEEVIEEEEIEEEVGEEENEVVDEEVSSELEEEEEKEPSEEEGIEITVGEVQAEEEVETEKAPQWVKDLRKKHKEQEKEVRRLKKENEELKASSVKTEDEINLGPKPTIESCEFDYDVLDRELDKWHELRKKKEEQERNRENELKAEEESWKKRIDSYEESKTKLKVEGIDEAEEHVKELLSVTQQGIIIKAAKDPAKLVYAIGKYPEYFRELIETKDPIEFAYMAGRLETEVKTTKRTPATSPEKTVSTGSSAGLKNTKKTIEKLEEEARRSGDYTKALEYKRKLREAEKKE